MTDLLAAVLEIAHEALLHRVKLGQLRRHRLADALHVFRALGEAPAALDAVGGDLEGALGASVACQRVNRPE